MVSRPIEIDIPCDPQQLGEFAMPFALLSEARDPARIVVGAIVITADEEDPSSLASMRSRPARTAQPS